MAKGDFDIKKYLTENKLTKVSKLNSKVLKEEVDKLVGKTVNHVAITEDNKVQIYFDDDTMFVTENTKGTLVTETTFKK